MKFAIRPLFQEWKSKWPAFFEKDIKFIWHWWFNISQKQKSIQEFHNVCLELWHRNILEVSTKSNSKIWIQLSAFNLMIHTKQWKISIEQLYQSSKVFENGWPYRDMIYKEPRELKSDIRLSNSGNLVWFVFNWFKRDLKLKSWFYDRLYLIWLLQNSDILVEVLNYDWFTDIEFNPKKSFSCQARTCAIYKWMINNWLKDCIDINDPSKFINLSQLIYWDNWLLI